METIPQQTVKGLNRIVLYGPESTGKTSLAQGLAAHFKTQWVPEFARTYLQEKWEREQAVCALADLPHIVRGQIRWENERLLTAEKWLFCDTNALVTQVWSQTHFEGYCAPEIKKAVQDYHYDFYLLTQPDLPWVRDDLRDRPAAREEMFESFKYQLDKHNLPFALVGGKQASRLQNAITALKKWEESLI